MEIEKGKFLYMGIINPNLAKHMILKLVEFGISINQIRSEKATIFAQNGDYIVNLIPPDNPTQLIIGRVKNTEQNNPQEEVKGQEGTIQYDPVLTTDFKFGYCSIHGTYYSCSESGHRSLNNVKKRRFVLDFFDIVD